MTKAIRSYPQSERKSVVSRRIEKKSGGLGYWGAMDAQRHQGEAKKVEAVKPAETEDAPAEE